MRKMDQLIGYHPSSKEIRWRLNYEVPEPTYKQLKDSDAIAVYIYHELVHALRDIAGVFIRSSTGQSWVGTFPIEEEYSTVGLFEYADYLYSENAFRKFNNLPRRPCYSRGGHSYWEERRRRYFLMLPIPTDKKKKDSYNNFEFQHEPGPGYTHKIDKLKLIKYTSKYYAKEQKERPHGFPTNLKPAETKRKDGYGKPLTELPKLL